MSVTTAAFVGAVGGAGTTRTTLELAALLAGDGSDVAVLDAAYETQGLARHLRGPLEPDLTTLVTDDLDAPLETAAVDPGWGLAGSVAVHPAHAPFERLTRAKDPMGAQALVERVREAAAGFDHVLLDVPPIGANQAVAAVDAADRVAVVAPATTHGLDGAQAARERLDDVQNPADAVVAVTVAAGGRVGLGRGGTRGGAGGEVAVDPDAAADAVLPATRRGVPACLEDAAFGRACAEVARVVLETEVTVSTEGGGVLGGRLEPAVERLGDRLASVRERVAPRLGGRGGAGR